MKSSLDHPQREQLTAFVWGHLNAAERAAIENHIADCNTCCQALREIPDDTLMIRLRGVHKTAVDCDSRSAADDQATLQTPPKELRDHPRYKVKRFLGAGGMGAVFKAEHRLMERKVALKIIHRDLICHPLAIKCFRQEVKAAARLAHPNIVTAFDAEQEGDLHFLVMEYVDGISLARLVNKRGPLGMSHACNYARQAAQGLQHAFENGMVHRDIKPHNLMLTRKGQIKILDFGLARLVADPANHPGVASRMGGPRATLAGDIMGTPDFMAPEQTVDSSRVDIRADIYSLGCTLYYLLSGETPFGDGSPATKLFLQTHHQPRPVKELCHDLPQELATIIGKMMAKVPAERYATPLEVVKALAPFSKPVPAAPPGPGPDPKKKPARAQEPALESVAFSGAPSSVARTFLSRCHYCPTKIRVPDKACGASILCPRCGNYFTAVPEGNAKFID